MTYFGGSSRMAGDPGFLGSFFKRAFRGVAGLATGGVAGAVASQFTRGGRGSSGGFVRPAGQRFVRPVTKVPGLRGAGQRFVPGGATGFQVMADGSVRRKSRRMNVGNAKALRRAIRRTDGFVRLAKGALKNTGFKIVSKSSGKVSRATMDKAVAAAHHRGK